MDSKLKTFLNTHKIFKKKKKQNTHTHTYLELIYISKNHQALITYFLGVK